MQKVNIQFMVPAKQREASLYLYHAMVIGASFSLIHKEQAKYVGGFNVQGDMSRLRKWILQFADESNLRQQLGADGHLSLQLPNDESEPAAVFAIPVQPIAASLVHVLTRSSPTSQRRSARSISHIATENEARHRCHCKPLTDGGLSVEIEGLTQFRFGASSPDSVPLRDPSSSKHVR